VCASSNASRRRRYACISDEEEGNTDAKDAHKVNATDTDNDTAANDAAPDNDNYATMPPKVKPLPRMPGAKKTNSNNVAAMLLPAPKPPVNFSLNSTDKFPVLYYCEGSQDYADMVFHTGLMWPSG
jgi:hypothetical protein